MSTLTDAILNLLQSRAEGTSFTPQSVVAFWHDDQPAGTREDIVGRIPLVWCRSLKDLERDRLHFPPECVFESNELNDLDALLKRIEVLLQVWQMHNDKNRAVMWRDFCVGAYRHSLLIAESAHDKDKVDSSCLTAGNADSVRKFAEDVIERMGRPPAAPIVQNIFDSNHAGLSALLSGCKANTDAEVALAAKLVKELIPRSYGERIAASTTSGRLSLLVIDDDVKADGILKDTEIRRPTTYNESQKTIGDKLVDKLDQYFLFSQLCPTAPEGLSCITRAVMSLPPMTRMQYDAILLDLSFGEPGKDDPLGYLAIPFLQRSFPNIPIIIYSSYGDIGHMARAFELGARWYVKKGSEWKLPSHFVTLHENPNWKREWDTVRNSNGPPLFRKFPAECPDDATRDIYQYLIWRVTRDLPGGALSVDTLTGGKGESYTCMVRKCIGMEFDHQAPVIIKIGTPFDTQLERDRYRWFIRPYIGNRVGRIDEKPFLLDKQWGAVAYTCAGLGVGKSDVAARLELRTLRDLLKENVTDHSKDVLSAEEYRDVMNDLLREGVSRLHHIRTDYKADDDYPNLLLEETEHPINAYLYRMPPEEEINVDAFYETPDQIQDHSENHHRVLMLEAKPPKGSNAAYIKAIRFDKEGLAHRLDLVGDMADFMVRYRHIRNNKAIYVTGPLKNKEKQYWNELGLFSSEDESPLCFSETIKGMDAEGIITLRKWLVKESSTRFASSRKAIIHGDLNLGNVMVERAPSGLPKPAHAHTWLIDFARTRREIIVFDYAQLFGDIFLTLFKPALIPTANADAFLKIFLESALTTPHAIPDLVKDDPRMEFVYRMMGMVHDAAREQGIKNKELQLAFALNMLFLPKIFHEPDPKKRKPENEHRKHLAFAAAVITAHMLGHTHSGPTP